MSQENVDLVRRMTEVANITPADASLFEPLLAPDYRIENTVTAVVPSVASWVLSPSYSAVIVSLRSGFAVVAVGL